jgi:cytochrome c oxidase subunit 3
MTQASKPAVPADAEQAAHEEHYDPVGNRIGMWLFLTTEILLFSVLFIIYAVYHHDYKPGFAVAAEELNRFLGALNTVILLTSSLTVALSITALQKGKNTLCSRLLGATIVMAGLFLVIKSFEWQAKFDHGLYPGSEHMLDLSKGENLFFGLYFLSTGLHALHVIIGMTLLSIVLWRVRAGKVNAERISLLENSGLYWHLVDLVWIYIFPLYYLIA